MNEPAHPISVHYRIDGEPDAPVIMLSHSLAANLDMWGAQVPALVQAGFRVLRYDSRGHGRSPVPPGPYTLEQLTLDAVALLDKLDLRRVDFMGCSKGGMVGQMLAARYPDRVNALVLTATAAHLPPAQLWNDRISAVRAGGMEAVVDATVDRWFTGSGQLRLSEAVDRIRTGILATPAAGFCACCEAIRDMDQRESVRTITAPTLVLVGEHDPSTPVAAAQLIHERITGSKLEVLADCAHFTHVEQAETFNRHCLSFLANAAAR